MISGINWEDQQNKENGGSFVITRAYPNSKNLELGFKRNWADANEVLPTEKDMSRILRLEMTKFSQGHPANSGENFENECQEGNNSSKIDNPILGLLHRSSSGDSSQTELPAFKTAPG